MEFPGTKDLFQHRYYRMNKMFLKWLGLWPYQTARTRSVAFAMVLLIMASKIVPEAIAIVKHCDDWEFLVEGSIPLSFDACCLTKLFTSTFNSQKMSRLLNRMRTDWADRPGDRDVNIFHDYAENGRKITVTYTVLVYTTWTLFVTQPIVPKVLDVVLRNGTDPGEFVVPVDYLVIDLQKYYFYIILHTVISQFLALNIVSASDSMFVVYIQHACGLYAVLGHNLERIGKNEKPSESKDTTHPLDNPNMNYAHLVTCIKRHNDAITYSELIEASYSWCFLFIVGFNVFLISLTGLEIVMRTTDPHQTIRFIVSNIVSMVHLFMESYMAQILMDHSIKIHYNILNSEWHKLPLKAQKILLFIIMRCNMPSQLTAGNVFIMSIESFVVLLKTSLSYFTLLRSV